VKAIVMRRFLECLVYCVGAVLLMLFSGPLIIGALNAYYGDLAEVPPAVLGNLILVSPVFPLLLGIAALVRLKAGGVDIARLVGISRVTIGGDLLVGAALGAIGLAMALISLFLLSPFLPLPPFRQIPVTAHLYLATIGAVVPGICEELFFRGMLFKVAAPAPRWLLVVGTALAFSLWHISNPIYLPHTFLLGLLLGAVVAARGRLAPAIIGHTLANASFGAWILAGLPLPGG
jgi:membrane protease YdiL (CAAX protease family)